MSNRAWITRLAVAGVVGSSGAAFAGMSIDDPVAMPSELPAAITDTSAPSATVAQLTDTTVTYQVGPAGSVALTRTGDVLTVTTATAGEGWTMLGASAPSSHVTVQFSDTLQVVTFIADAMGDDVAVMVENLPVGTVATMPTATAGSSSSGGSRPAPATPATAAAPATYAPSTTPSTPSITEPAPDTTTPSSASTTAPSSGGDDDEDHEDEEHEDEDHEDEDGEDD